eukprot:TRINITY_DN121820_c0_g1_i1.p1 TRINITY_DN121820_c0_g1~~TRINITY_DN121820_c0_g1_i1.p1  ORF type:complete len:298 (+),score=51.63 TRINITY_DN121820_c0_g1_i1:70-963(+)
MPSRKTASYGESRQKTTGVIHQVFKDDFKREFAGRHGMTGLACRSIPASTKQSVEPEGFHHIGSISADSFHSGSSFYKPPGEQLGSGSFSQTMGSFASTVASRPMTSLSSASFVGSEGRQARRSLVYGAELAAPAANDGRAQRPGAQRWMKDLKFTEGDMGLRRQRNGQSDDAASRPPTGYRATEVPGPGSLHDTMLTRVSSAPSLSPPGSLGATGSLGAEESLCSVKWPMDGYSYSSKKARGVTPGPKGIRSGIIRREIEDQLLRTPVLMFMFNPTEVPHCAFTKDALECRSDPKY